MGKRSNFERRDRDFYPTPKKAVDPLIPYVFTVNFQEPCAGNGDLVVLLELSGMKCHFAGDIEPGNDKIVLYDAFRLKHSKWPIITNPPWDRKILHPMIEHFLEVAPHSWLLFDADWMHTKQASKLITKCRKIISVGRVKWIPDSKYTGKDNCCWYLFSKEGAEGTEFIGRTND